MANIPIQVIITEAVQAEHDGEYYILAKVKNFDAWWKLEIAEAPLTAEEFDEMMRLAGENDE